MLTLLTIQLTPTSPRGTQVRVNRQMTRKELEQYRDHMKEVLAGLGLELYDLGVTSREETDQVEKDPEPEHEQTEEYVSRKPKFKHL